MKLQSDGEPPAFSRNFILVLSSSCRRYCVIVPPRSNLWPVTAAADEVNRSYSTTGSYGEVNTSAPLDLPFWRHGGFCPHVVGWRGSRGAGTRHKLWHANNASRDKQIFARFTEWKDLWGKKRLLHWSCYQQLFVGSSFFYVYLMGRCWSSPPLPPPTLPLLPPPEVEQIAGIGPTKLLLSRITKTFQICPSEESDELSW